MFKVPIVDETVLTPWSVAVVMVGLTVIPSIAAVNVKERSSRLRSTAVS